MRDVRMVLVGDGELINPRFVDLHPDSRRPDGVGKSTIVTSLIKESFMPHVSVLL